MGIFEDIWDSIWDAPSDVAAWIADQVADMFDFAKIFQDIGFAYLKYLITDGQAFIFDYTMPAIRALPQLTFEVFTPSFATFYTWFDNNTYSVASIPPEVEALLTPIINASAGVVMSGFNTSLDVWGAAIQLTAAGFTASLSIATLGLEAAWDDSVKGILEGLGPIFESAGKTILGLVTAQFKTFPNFFLGLIEFSVVDDLMGKGKVIFDRLFSGITDTLWALLSGLFPKTPTKPEDAENVVRHIMTLMLGGTASIGGAIMLGELVHPFKEVGLKYVSAMMFKIADFQSIGSAITLSFATPAFIIPLQRAMNVRYQPSLPGIEDLIKFLVREQITPDEFDATMLYHGFSAYWSEKYWGAHWILPGLTLSREMVNRELINDIEYKELLTLNDMMPKWIDRVAATRWRIPGITDAIRFAVREVWEREGKNTVEEFRRHMKSLGYDPIWANRYWDAHWELVPIGRLYEMFYREVITKAELEAELVKHDYRPEWVDNLIKVSYRQIPIIYLRRAWELGVLTDANLELELQKHGYDPVIIPSLAAIVKRMALENEVAEVRREEIAEYQEGFSSKEELHASITVLGYKDVVVDYFVRKAELRLERVERKEKKKVLIHSYRKDIITVDQFREDLLLIEMQPEFVERLIVLEAIRKTKGIEELMVELIGS